MNHIFTSKCAYRDRDGRRTVVKCLSVYNGFNLQLGIIRNNYLNYM